MRCAYSICFLILIFQIPGCVFGLSAPVNSDMFKHIKSLKADNARITALAFSSSTDMLAAGSENNTIKLISATTWKENKEINPHAPYCRFEQFTPDGKHVLVIARKEKVIELRSIETNEVIRKYELPISDVRVVAISSDGTHVAFSGTEAVIISTIEGQMICYLDGYPSGLFENGFSYDNKYFWGSDRFKFSIWDAKTGELKYTFGNHLIIAMGKNSSIYATLQSNIENIINIYSVESGELIKKIILNNDIKIHTASFASSDKYLVVGIFIKGSPANRKGSSETIIINLENDEKIRLNVGRNFILSNDDKYIAVNEYRYFYIYNLTTGNSIITLGKIDSSEEYWQLIKFSPDNRKLVTSFGYGNSGIRLRIWDVITGEIIFESNEIWSSFKDIVFSSNNDFISINGGLCEQTNLNFWSDNSSEPVKTYYGAESGIRELWFIDNDKKLVSLGNDNTIRITESISGNTIKTVKSKAPNIYSAVITTDETKILIYGEIIKRIEYLSESQSLEDLRSKIEVWSLPDGEYLRTIETEERPITSMKIMPDGKSVACLHGGIVNCGPSHIPCQIKIWSIDTGELIKTYGYNINKVSDICVSPDGNYIAGVEHHGKLRIWNTQTGKVSTYGEEMLHPYDCSFNHDGSLIAYNEILSLVICNRKNGKTIDHVYPKYSGALFANSEHGAGTASYEFSSSENYLAVGRSDGFIDIWKY